MKYIVCKPTHSARLTIVIGRAKAEITVIKLKYISRRKFGLSYSNGIVIVFMVYVSLRYFKYK